MLPRIDESEVAQRRRKIPEMLGGRSHRIWTMTNSKGWRRDHGPSIGTIH